MKLWQKKGEMNGKIEQFTVGNDFALDKELVRFDCIASVAHAKMLFKIGVLTDTETSCIVRELENIIRLDEKKEFVIRQKDEDCHTAIENRLVEKLGETGKKIHTARSRNDQVLAALRLYEKNRLLKTMELLKQFINVLENVSVRSGHVKIPGYTHMQKAMPSSVGMWLGCFVESAQDNLLVLESALKLVDQSPLGTAAGFGVPVFEVDSELTADLMGFSRVQKNPIYAQLSLGKFESTVLHALTQVMFDLNKLSSDLVLFSMSEFGFFSLPAEFCTGSSIMPQKKNPDVLELVRARYHCVLADEFKVKSLSSNLISGYNRDIQLTKEPVMASFKCTIDCLEIMCLVVAGLKVNKENCSKACSKELSATEKAYKLVKKGAAFRDAYRKVGEEYSG